MKCDSSLTFIPLPITASRTSTIARLRVTPPVNVISPSMPTRLRSPNERRAID